MGLFSLSGGLRNMVGDTLSQVQGVMVLRENSPEPGLQRPPGRHGAEIAEVPGVRVVAPGGLGDRPEHRGAEPRSAASCRARGCRCAPRPAGDPGPGHRGPRQLKSAVYPRALKEKGEGRFLDARRRGQAERRHQPEDRPATTPSADGKPRKVGDTLKIGGKDVHDHRDVRDRLDAPRRRDRHGHRHGPDAR